MGRAGEVRDTGVWGGNPTPPWDGFSATRVFRGLHLPPRGIRLSASLRFT